MINPINPNEEEYKINSDCDIVVKHQRVSPDSVEIHIAVLRVYPQQTEVFIFQSTDINKVKSHILAYIQDIQDGVMRIRGEVIQNMGC